MSIPRILLVCLFPLLLLACAQDDEDATGERAIPIDVWLHAGSPEEQRALQAQVADFNASQYRIRVNAVILPGADYERRIQEAAAAGHLPDIIEVPPDRVARYAWLGFIHPIDKLLTDETHGRLLAPVRSAGSYSGRIYAIASHVGSILLYARRDLLEKRGIELPPSGQSWDLARFTSILEGLAVGEPGRPVLEIDLGPHRRHAAEALLPALASAGGALIDLRDRPRVLGVFDSQENISVLSRLRDWMRKGWLVVRPDDGAGRFADGGVPLSWAWSSAGDVYRRRWGDAVAVLPLPDFARGSRFLIDAWGWAVTRDSAHVQAAMSLLEFMLEDARQLTIAQTGHSLPASRRALSAWADEGRGEAALLHRAGLDAFVVVPPTPAYPLIARTLNKVVGEVLSGQDPGPRLHEEALALQHKIAGFERP